MTNTRIFIVLILTLGFSFILAPAGFAKNSGKKPKVQWSQKEVAIIAKSGDSYSVDLQFESDGALSDVSLWVVPELQPYISVSPTDFATIGPDTLYSVIINVNIPYGTEDASYDGTIHLKDGSSTIPATLKVALTIDNQPLITITSPETFTTVGSSPITVTGTVDDPDAIVTVNGVTVAVSGDTFTVSGITLTEGSNTITATAIDAVNNVGTSHVTIYMDSTPPIVTINSHEDGHVATSSPITVTGIIFDIVKGTVNENNATVDVNGISASVSNKTFMVEDLPLVEGENTITATAADQTGNTANTSISIMLDLSINKKINMVSGNNQTGTINTQLPGTLVISLTNADGSPASGETVIIKVTQNNGLLTGNSGTAASLAEITDINGEPVYCLHLVQLQELVITR